MYQGFYNCHAKKGCWLIFIYALHRRDKRVFNRHMIQRLIRECSKRDSYIGAPWLIKVDFLFGLETEVILKTLNRSKRQENNC